MRAVAGAMSAAAIGFSLTACDLGKSMQSELQTFKRNIVRSAHRILAEIRADLGVAAQMRSIAAPTKVQPTTKFIQSIGVNVHIAFTWTSYANVSLVASELAYLGIRNVRDDFFRFSDWPKTQSGYQQLASAGIQFDFILPVYIPSHAVNVTEFVSMVDAFVQTNPGSLNAIEGPNEVNLTPAMYNGGAAPADQTELQRALYEAVRSDPNLIGIPVYALTIGGDSASAFEPYGDLSRYADFGNAHPYLPDDSTPQSELEYLLPIQAAINAPGLPIVITETGWTTDQIYPYNGADQATQAKLTLDTLMDAFNYGVLRTYFYELMDEASDRITNDQNHYGLFNPDGTPKLVAAALHNLTTILADPGSTSPFSQGSLSYTVANLPSNGNQLLLEKSSGTFDLVLWAEAPIWNSSTRSEIVAPTETTTVNFGQRQKTVLMFDPLRGTTPIAVYSNIQSLQVELTDHPIIIEILNDAASLTTPKIN